MSLFSLGKAKPGCRESHTVYRVVKSEGVGVVSSEYVWGRSK